MFFKKKISFKIRTRLFSSRFGALFYLIGLLSLNGSLTRAESYLLIEKEKIKVEIADTPEKRARGLMFRKTLAEHEGMLFIFNEEEKRSFWMKNTFISLSIGFFDKEKKLLEIIDMDPVQSHNEKDLKVYQSNIKAMYALEVPRGWFKRKKIKLLSKFALSN